MDESYTIKLGRFKIVLSVFPELNPICGIQKNKKGYCIDLGKISLFVGTN